MAPLDPVKYIGSAGGPVLTHFGNQITSSRTRKQASSLPLPQSRTRAYRQARLKQKLKLK
jgi:hypothetical protein